MNNTGELVFLFADLSGFTALTEAHGDDQAADCAARFFEVVGQSLTGDAWLVKKIGDAVMVVASQPNFAVDTALKLLQLIQAEPGFPAVRCGIHQGQAVERDGDYYGAAVNLAARITAYARSDQVLCTKPVADALRGQSMQFRPVGSIPFKNMSQPVDVFEISVFSGEASGSSIDPVCRMRLDPGYAPARLPYQGHEFYFCSLRCAQAFIQSPEVYMNKKGE